MVLDNDRSGTHALCRCLGLVAAGDNALSVKGKSVRGIELQEKLVGHVQWSQAIFVAIQIR